MTRGELYERYLKYDKDLPTHAIIGDVVYRSGGTFEDTCQVTVVSNDDSRAYRADTYRKYETFALVNAYWNSIYYSSYDEAEKNSRACRAEYGRHLASL